MSFFADIAEFFDNLGDRLRGEHKERRREDRELEITLASNNLLSSESSSSPRVVSVDLQPKENALQHHCENYELVTRGKGTAIIRRSGTFTLEVELNQDVDLKKEQQLTIYFNFGPRPLVSKGTQEVQLITGKKEFDKKYDDWDHRVINQEGHKATIEIQVPHDVPVGVWMLAFELQSRHDSNTSNRHLFRLDSLLYILFNPWSKHDDVYMKTEDFRQEYLLNDVGKIWIGGYPTARGRQWVFGQFDDAVLPASVLLLEKSGLNPEQRGDPVMITRAISRIVNSNDDLGVVFGRWDGKYEDGTSPSAWSGSIKILEDYMSKNAPVKYGQCWVFSGVTTTVCRAIGIPCRSVSNMNSAHDTNMSLTIDKYFDKDGEEYKPRAGNTPEGFSDSIWNFHVWNDVWMARPDLPPGFGGWQAIDATPQEKSQGLYQCGPASLEAVRSGQTNLNYDVNFVLAEVNADVIRWQRDEGEKDGFKKLNSNKAHVGRQLLTKKPGKMSENFFEDREDCTMEYKASEGSNAERVTLFSAVRRTQAARRAFRFPSVAEEDVEFDLVDIERVPIGENFSVAVKVTNKAEATRTISLILSAASEYYNGIKANPIKKAEGMFELKGGEEENFKLPITHNEYFDKLVEYAMIKLTAIANVKETTQTWIDEDTFQVIKPTIKIELLGEPKVNHVLPVKFSFKNPLNIPLRNCFLVYDGPGLTRPKQVSLPDVPANGDMVFEHSLYPLRDGQRSLIATFNSKELIDITGSTSVDVPE